jgi:hypothetical protein
MLNRPRAPPKSLCILLNDRTGNGTDTIPQTIKPRAKSPIRFWVFDGPRYFDGSVTIHEYHVTHLTFLFRYYKLK